MRQHKAATPRGSSRSVNFDIKSCNLSGRVATSEGHFEFDEANCADYRVLDRIMREVSLQECLREIDSDSGVNAENYQLGSGEMKSEGKPRSTQPLD